MEKLESREKLKLKKFYEKIHEYIKKNIKEKWKNNNNNYDRWQWIMVVGKGKKRKKWETWQVVSKIYWYEKNNKNKLQMYLSICSIKLMCILFFTFESNCETNLKAVHD